MPLRRTLAAYLALQGSLVIAWWVGLHVSPAFRALFLPPGMPDAQLLAFWLPDLGLAAGGSLAAAGGVLGERRWAAPLVWALAGAIAYAALYCLALSLLTHGAWVASVAMLPAMLLTSASALLLTRSTPAHAQGRSAP